MHFITLIIVIAAAAAFGVDYARTKQLMPLGLLLLTVALTLQFLIETGNDRITIG